MAVGIFTGEAMAYRTVGMMDAAIAALAHTHSGDMSEVRKVIDEYAIECSILKVWGSELLDYVVDEMVQIYGGYGFVAEYPAERAYRDSRVNRIFEGTNEINRLVITGFLLKRAMSGHLPLLPVIKKLVDEVISGSISDNHDGGLFPDEQKLVANAKKITLFTAGIASQKYMQAMQDQQEILGAIADMVIETYAMESALLRAQKIGLRGGAGLAAAMMQVYLERGIERIEGAAKRVIAAASEGDRQRSQMAILRRLGKHEPLNTISLRQKIAQRVIEAGKYVIV
jgi:butyryl-CoA dehydrogenase